MRALGLAAVSATALAVGTGGAAAADSFVHAGKHGVGKARAISGFIEGRYGDFGTVNDAGAAAPLEVEGGKWTLRGTVNARAGSFNVQVEAEGSAVDTGPYESAIGNGTLHAYFRPTHGSYAVGAFIRGASEDFHDITEGSLLQGVTNDVLVGGEVAYLAKHATLHLRAGFGQRTDEPDAFDVEIEADRLHVGAGANVYIGENFRFDLDGTYDRVQNDDFGLDVDRFSVDGRANYRFAGAPVSVFAGYRYETREVRSMVVGSEEEDSNLGTLYAGARLHFGTKTLKQEDRSGALWDTLDVMPR